MQQTISRAPETGDDVVLNKAAKDSAPGASEVNDTQAQELKNDSATELSKTEAIKPTPYLKHHAVSLELYISPEHATKDLSEKPSQVEAGYLNLRRQSETINNAFSAGINLRYEISEHYFVRAGIRYSVINENVYYKQPKSIAVPSSIDSTIKGYIVDPFLPPVTIYKYDTTYSFKTVYTDQAAHNRYTFIDIPVSAGIQFGFKQFNFYISAGLELNFLAASSGVIAGIATDTIDLNSAGTPFKKVSLSVQSGIGCAYHVSPAFEFIIEPNFFQAAK